MHLMYTEDPETGKRIYTLKKVFGGTVTKSAHPARFSPDDKYSRFAACSLHERMLIGRLQASSNAQETLWAPVNSERFGRQLHRLHHI